jgi:flagellar biosynthesis component FlhA
MRLLFALAILAITSSPIESNKRKDYKQHVRRHKDSESTTSSTVAAFSTVAGLDLGSTESIAAAAAAKKSKRKKHKEQKKEQDEKPEDESEENEESESAKSSKSGKSQMPHSSKAGKAEHPSSFRPSSFPTLNLPRPCNQKKQEKCCNPGGIDQRPKKQCKYCVC